ncbi:maltose ABC transporter substrate-binding protein MalE [Hahella sp. CCB-MM4]|uniref:maltose/maltodextrin ABC transporter substrate-binding protein MalE n=1 Tax=Hahella sp. (strain CCB-MM4) TaxID=1926491 RepID=UPI000B9A3FBC|nr:maltose/maltodextrin ABC transporter substrate-binding protein MalE [Hahella sp. CCB-MM4]OZG75156.1 maltose ABC transporter substrate-binding protein MalE [Hahella sp. CCB-MM4]
MINSLKLSFLSCALLSVFSISAGAASDPELLLWIGSDKGFNGVAEVGRRFEAETGISVRVETPDSLTTKFDRLAPTAQGPDIVIWAHDRFGPWINEGFLEPVTPSVTMRNSVAPFTWDALTVGDRIYGFPIAIEAVSLIYNKALVSTPPKTLKDVEQLDRQLAKQSKKALVWDFNNTYFTWPIIAATGAYSFGKEDGIYDLTDVGFDNAGASRAIDSIRGLIERKIVPGDANYGSMMDGFKSGNVAMIINGPWAWNEIRESGIEFGVDYIPSVEASKPGKPFVGVLSAAINVASQKKEAAQKFLEDYLLTYEGLKVVNADKPLGAVANIRLMKELARDPLIFHTFESAEKGELMPDLPEMKRFWSLFSTKLPQMLKGEADISPTLADIAGRLRKLDELKGWRRRHYLADIN